MYVYNMYGFMYLMIIILSDTCQEDEDDKTLLQELDYISFFEQFPFTELFQYILKIGANGMELSEWDTGRGLYCSLISCVVFAGELVVAETTSHQMLRLVAFSTCLVRLLGAAFTTLRQARYKEFVKQVGRTIR